MKYSSHLLVKTYIIILTATWGSCWQFFTPLTDITLIGTTPEEQYIHSEYYFGHCKSKTIKFYTHTHLDRTQVLGKVIVRGWIDVIRIPTCIILRAMSFHGNLLRSSAYTFQLCVPRISYCHAKVRHLYHYYEIYVPPDLIGGMDWEILFFGPPTRAW